ncbi:MAG: hypothetical protein K8R25_03915 [Methanosarcinales archaeon]|nr:hypothetical protein [Methanosarcinales archaeon]
MNISSEYRTILADEINYCRAKINAESDLRKKAYYYSSAYGMTRRIFNLEFDPQLQFIDFILNSSYQAIFSRIAILMSGDNTIPITDEFFDGLNNCLELLEDRIRNNEDTYDVLEKIVNLMSTIDGNGYYLMQKGVPVYTE